MVKPTREAADVFRVWIRGDLAVITTRGNLGELGFGRIEASANRVLAALDRSAARNVLVDLRRADYLGSTALGALVGFWRWAQMRKGRMVVCRASNSVRNVFRVTRLEELWPVCSTLREALQVVPTNH